MLSRNMKGFLEDVRAGIFIFFVISAGVLGVVFLCLIANPFAWAAFITYMILRGV